MHILQSSTAAPAVARAIALSLLLGGIAAPGYPATITVTSVGDTVAVDGGVTLREAVLSVNGGANVNADVVAVGAYGVNDRINFAIPGAGVHTISPTAALPGITVPVFIDGYSQPGASPNTLAVDSNANLLIELSGASAGGGVDGLTISGGNSTVRGLVVNRFSGGKGIQVSALAGNQGNVIAGNFIGTDPTGTTRSGVDFASNNQGITVGSANNTIGGTTPGARNVVSGSFNFGVSINSGIAQGNVVQGNYIGTNAAGTAAIANSGGVSIFGFNNTIGGTTASARNVISGNAGNGGVNFNGAPTTGNVVQGNFIGVTPAGTAALSNTGNGISLEGASGNTVGGTAAGAGNVIAGNGQSGVDIRNSSNNNAVQGNLIGTDLTGTVGIPNGGGVVIFGGSSNNLIGGTVAGAGNRIAFNGIAGVRVLNPSTVNNTIQGNSIVSNTGLGIDLNGDGVTANDALDPDTGPNNLQNYPVLSSAASGSGTTTVSGSLNSTAGTAFRVEFFSNATCDATGFGEGQTFLGASNVSTDGSGNATVNVTLPVNVTPGQLVTATATDPGGNTSEFSACLAVPGVPGAVVATPIPTLSPWVGAVLTLLLLATGMIWARRARRSAS